MSYRVVKDFESALCDYTGARFAVTTTSCTMALLLACKWDVGHRIAGYNANFINREIVQQLKSFEIPCRTYVGVPQSIINAGGKVKFRDAGWSGEYQLKPSLILDSARRFTSGMHTPCTVQCVSFHWNKILGIQQGGAILHDNAEADKWFRRMRFDGRTEGVAPKDDTFTEIGYHCYMAPETAAQGLVRLSHLPLYNDDLPNDDYPDLSKLDIFKP